MACLSIVNQRVKVVFSGPMVSVTWDNGRMDLSRELAFGRVGRMTFMLANGGMV